MGRDPFPTRFRYSMGLFSRSVATHFPPVSGVRMDGGAFDLPGALGAATLIVVSFDDDAAPLAGQWARLGARLADHTPGLDVLDLVVVPPRLKLVGDLALISIRARAEAAGTQAQTGVAYAKPKAVRKALGVSRGDVVALLLGPDGSITWRGDGEIDLHEVEALEPAVAALLGERP